jgi:hypothetical protein
MSSAYPSTTRSQEIRSRIAGKVATPVTARIPGTENTVWTPTAASCEATCHSKVYINNKGLSNRIDARNIRSIRDSTICKKGSIPIVQGTQAAEGVCTDEFLSRKPDFLLSAMHSHTFRWFSAAPLVF